jgi:dynein light chain Tctex-type 1
MDNDPGMDQMTEDDLLDDAEIDTLVREVVTGAVGDSPFALAKIDAWTGNIVEGCLKRLAALNKPFKYVITCNLSQKAGAGLHAGACSCPRAPPGTCRARAVRGGARSGCMPRLQ